MRSHLHFSTLGKVGLVLLLFIMIVLPQMAFSDVDITGIRLPLRNGHSIDVAVLAFAFFFVIFVQKLRHKPLNHYAGDLVVFSFLLAGLIAFVLGVFL